MSPYPIKRLKRPLICLLAIYTEEELQPIRFDWEILSVSAWQKVEEIKGVV